MGKQKRPEISALVTARGNNTLANKHLILVNNKPLIWYPLNVARKCPSIGRHYISSDDDTILRLGEDEGYIAIKRPDEISLPTSMHIDAIIHALKAITSMEGREPEILIVLLGNTVYFKQEWIEDSIRLLTKNDHLSAVVPVYLQNDHHPYRAKYIDENGNLKPYFNFSKGNISTNRQDLPHNYFFCHNFWTLRVDKSVHGKGGQPPWTFMGDNIMPIVLNGGPDVHEKKDIELCELWVRDNKGTII